jgi:hypothetical protein
VGTSKNHGGQGLHNKPIGCGASEAYALGPDDEEEEILQFLSVSIMPLMLHIHSFICHQCYTILAAGSIIKQTLKQQSITYCPMTCQILNNKLKRMWKKAVIWSIKIE